MVCLASHQAGHLALCLQRGCACVGGCRLLHISSAGHVVDVGRSPVSDKVDVAVVSQPPVPVAHTRAAHVWCPLQGQLRGNKVHEATLRACYAAGYGSMIT